MKVEFKQQAEGEFALHIEDQEFYKARINQAEFDSAKLAVDSFLGIYGIGDAFDQEMYDFVLDQFSDDPEVAVFTVSTDDDMENIEINIDIQDRPAS